MDNIYIYIYGFGNIYIYKIYKTKYRRTVYAK